jgi:hypothetical protein
LGKDARPSAELVPAPAIMAVVTKTRLAIQTSIETAMVKDKPVLHVLASGRANGDGLTSLLVKE